MRLGWFYLVFVLELALLSRPASRCGKMERMSAWFMELQNDVEDVKWWAEQYFGVFEDEIVVENTISNESTLSREEALQLWDRTEQERGADAQRANLDWEKQSLNKSRAAAALHDSDSFGERFETRKGSKGVSGILKTASLRSNSFEYESDSQNSLQSSSSSTASYLKNVSFQETVTIFRF